MSTDLHRIRAFTDLIRYLEDELDWPLSDYDFDELTFEYTPDELGLKAEDAAKIKGGRIYKLRPPPGGMPWGIFFVEFEKKKLPVVVLRRILGSLAIKKRASANRADRAAFALRDVMFITAFGEAAHPEIAFAHFHHNADSPGDLPTLRVLGWDDQDTVAKLDHLQKNVLPALRWPENPDDQNQWRSQWSKPFRLRPGQVIRSTKELAAMLAAFSKKVRYRVEQLLDKEHDQGPLQRLLAAMRTGLIHDMSEPQFADMFAQTIAYGLLLQRFGRSYTNVSGLLQLVVGNEFLRELLEQFLQRSGRRDGLDFDEAGIQEIVDFLDSPDVVIDDILRDFNQQNPQEDPVIHFYEYYLQAYNPAERKKRGVYYTPRPVVSYIVRSVHELLQTEFGLEDGLASTITWGEMAARLKSEISNSEFEISNFTIHRHVPRLSFRDDPRSGDGNGDILVRVHRRDRADGEDPLGTRAGEAASGRAQDVGGRRDSPPLARVRAATSAAAAVRLRNPNGPLHDRAAQASAQARRDGLSVLRGPALAALLDEQSGTTLGSGEQEPGEFV
jgi:hypothetical protein